MILIGIGANIPSSLGAPRATCGAALTALPRLGIEIAACSSWWQTAPIPASNQPWFVNAVAGVKTSLSPTELLSALLKAETAFGRVRSVPNADRVLDLDLLDYNGIISKPGTNEEGLNLPHPRMHERVFVLLPLLEIIPEWRHPETGRTAESLAGALPSGQAAFRMPQADGVFGTEWNREGGLPGI